MRPVRTTRRRRNRDVVPADRGLQRALRGMRPQRDVGPDADAPGPTVQETPTNERGDSRRSVRAEQAEPSRRGLIPDEHE